MQDGTSVAGERSEEGRSGHYLHAYDTRGPICRVGLCAHRGSALDRFRRLRIEVAGQQDIGLRAKSGGYG